jgi:hypothetical protein
MGGGGKGAAGTVAAAGIYTGGRIATNALTIGQAFVTAAAQIAAMKWMIEKQQSMWDHVSGKQIACVEVALDEFSKAVDALLLTFKDAYPDVPEAARFVAVDPQTEQFNTMVANIINGPKTAEYMVAANHWHRTNHMARVELLSPGFTALLSAHMRQIEALLAGTLPVDEAVAVVSDDAEAAAMNGRVGNTRMISAASLGIRRLQIQQLGRDEISRRLQWMEQVSPVSREVTLNELMVSPERRLLFALEQAQLLQNDLQNAHNAAAQKAPHKMAELQTKLQRVVATLSFNANKANMQNQFVPNFPGIFGPSISNLTQLIGQAMTWEKDQDSPVLSGAQTPSTSTAVTV